WLNYYGVPETIPGLSYCEVTNQTDGFFRDKSVFVGGHPKTPYLFDETDEFRTPFTRWTGKYSPGVEIMATAFLNLQREDWLRRLSPVTEVLLIVLCGLLGGL